MQQQQISAIDVKLTGDVKSSDIAWLDVGEDILSVIKDLQEKGRVIIGFEYDGEKFGVILQ